MALEPRQMVTRRDLYQYKDLEIEHRQQEEYLPNTGINLLDTRIDVAAALTPPMVGDLIPFLCPLHYEASTAGWKVWTDGETIDGFCGGLTGLSLLESGDMKITATGSRMGIVIKGGKIPADQVFLPPGEDRNDLNANLRIGMRSKNFYITNLPGVA